MFEVYSLLPYYKIIFWEYNTYLINLVLKFFSSYFTSKEFQYLKELDASLVVRCYKNNENADFR